MAMLLGRYVPIVAALAIAGSLADEEDRARPRRARSAPTAPTFSVLLVGVIVLTAGLMILPALFLGPIVEGLSTDARASSSATSAPPSSRPSS